MDLSSIQHTNLYPYRFATNSSKNKSGNYVGLVSPFFLFHEYHLGMYNEDFTFFFHTIKVWAFDSAIVFNNRFRSLHHAKKKFIPRQNCCNINTVENGINWNGARKTIHLDIPTKSWLILQFGYPGVGSFIPLLMSNIHTMHSPMY